MSLGSLRRTSLKTAGTPFPYTVTVPSSVSRVSRPSVTFTLEPYGMGRPEAYRLPLTSTVPDAVPEATLPEGGGGGGCAAGHSAIVRAVIGMTVGVATTFRMSPVVCHDGVSVGVAPALKRRMNSIRAISAPFASIQRSPVTLMGFAAANVTGLSVGGGVLGPPVRVPSKTHVSSKGSLQTSPVIETVMW